MHGEQDETNQRSEGHEREYPKDIEKCTRQQYSELIVEQI